MQTGTTYHPAPAGTRFSCKDAAVSTPETPSDVPAGVAREGEPVFKWSIIDTPLGKMVFVQVMHGPSTFAVAMRPEVAIMVGEGMVEFGKVAKTGLHLPNNGKPAKP